MSENRLSEGEACNHTGRIIDTRRRVIRCGCGDVSQELSLDATISEIEYLRNKESDMSSFQSTNDLLAQTNEELLERLKEMREAMKSILEIIRCAEAEQRRKDAEICRSFPYDSLTTKHICEHLADTILAQGDES